jgi:hypothetical protein
MRRWIEVQLREAGPLAGNLERVASRVAVFSSTLRGILLGGCHARE